MAIPAAYRLLPLTLHHQSPELTTVLQERGPGIESSGISEKVYHLAWLVSSLEGKLSSPPKGIRATFTTPGRTAEQCLKEGKYALNWTRISCH